MSTESTTQPVESTEPGPATVLYTVVVWVKRGIWPGDAPAEYTSTEAKRSLEKEILHCLRRLDGDCDVEVTETMVQNEEGV